MLRAMSLEADSIIGPDEPQPPRSLTVHFLNTPSAGRAEIEVTVERKGHSTMFLSARLVQEGAVQGKAMAVFSALAAFATSRPYSRTSRWLRLPKILVKTFHKAVSPPGRPPGRWGSASEAG